MRQEFAASLDDTLSPADRDRLCRWEASGRPSIPLVVDADGLVHATTTNLRTILRSKNPELALFRVRAAVWVDAHCGD